MDRTNEHAPNPAPAARTVTDLTRLERPGTLSVETRAPELGPDARRRALERRIELTKERLIGDITRVRHMVREASGRAQRGLKRAATGTAIAVAGLVILGVVAALIRRRHRRIRITWR